MAQPCSERELDFFLNRNAFPEVRVGDKTRMFILLQCAPCPSQAIAVPSLPGIARKQREPQGAKAPAFALGGVFGVDFLKPFFQSAQQLNALLLAAQVSALDKD